MEYRRKQIRGRWNQHLGGIKKKQSQGKGRLTKGEYVIKTLGLSRSLVAKLWNSQGLQNDHELLMVEDTHLLCLKHLGDNLALITPKEGARLEDVLKSEWFVEYFKSVVKWSPEEISGHRLMWLRINEVPLSV